MISALSEEARQGIREYCDSLDLSELYAKAVHDAEACAWVWFILRAAPDRPEFFPKGKWATIQKLETVIDVAAYDVGRAYWRPLGRDQ